MPPQNPVFRVANTQLADVASVHAELEAQAAQHARHHRSDEDGITARLLDDVTVEERVHHCNESYK